MTTLTDVLQYMKHANTEDISAIGMAYRSRSTALHAERALEVVQSIDVGDKVRITGGIKPKYLIGLVGNVVDKESKCARVDFGRPVGKFRSIIGIPYSALEKVN